jgi:hypothetical protein
LCFSTALIGAKLIATRHWVSFSSEIMLASTFSRAVQ